MTRQFQFTVRIPRFNIEPTKEILLFIYAAQCKFNFPVRVVVNYTKRDKPCFLFIVHIFVAHCTIARSDSNRMESARDKRKKDNASAG